MRWPLRYQILLPLVGLMLITMLGVSLLNAYWSLRQTRRRIADQLVQIRDTLSATNFPLTDAVLRQMSGLAGAEFAVTERSGRVTAATIPAELAAEIAATLPAASPPTGTDPLLSPERREPTAFGLPGPTAFGLPGPIASDFPGRTRSLTYRGRNHFHVAARLDRRGGREPGMVLHVLYPEASYHEAWRDVVYPPLIVGAVAMVPLVGIGLAIASRVTRPVGKLRSQTEQIARGDFTPISVPHREDELADLARSVNQMSEMLASYEREVRRGERRRTLDQLGSGLAHQLRNAVTGCRMAVGLHARVCPESDDSLQVAGRELERMEQTLRRFLALGHTPATPRQPIDLRHVVARAAELVRPTAEHVGVRLGHQPPDHPQTMMGNAGSLEAMFVSLLLNGVEAASPAAAVADSHAAPPGGKKAPTVSIEFAACELAVEIVDSGPGPDAKIADQLFEPFVTGKPDGTGLGLAIARETARAHGGEVTWRREGDTTRFTVAFPRPEDPSRTESSPDQPAATRATLGQSVDR